MHNYDIDNAYPQRIKNIISNSGTASACVKLFAKFIKGDGFIDADFWKAKVNQYLTLDKLFYKLAADFAELHGFAILISYNVAGEAIAWDYIPFEYCRQGQKDSQDYNGKILVYNNWDKQNGSYNKKKFDLIDIYNPIPEVVQAQIDEAGNITKYKGQIYWYSVEGDVYPKAPCDAVLEDIRTDAEIKNFRLKNIETNFMASHMVEYPYKFDSDSEERDEAEKWSNMQGGKNTGKILLVQNPSLNEGGQAIKVTKFDNQDNDRMFLVTNQTTKDSIIQCYGQPPILLGVTVAGKLGNSDETRDAFEFYNNYTANDRRIFEEVFRELFEGKKIEGKLLNPSNVWTIGTLKFGEQTVLQRVGPYMSQLNELVSSSIARASKVRILQEVYGFTDVEANSFLPQDIADKPALINSIGIGGVTALTAIIQSAMDEIQKINTLSIVFGISKEDAQSMVQKTPVVTVLA